MLTLPAPAACPDPAAIQPHGIAISNPHLSSYLISDLPLADAVLPYLRRVDAARRYTNFGPLALEFEDKIAQRLTGLDPTPQHGAIKVVTLFSCYNALAIGLKLLGAGPGKRVLLPAITFPACPLAVQHAGADVLLADVDPTSWTLTPDIARRVAARHKIDVVMPVALYGVPLPPDAWDAFTRDTGIKVIFDAAAAIGAQTIPQHIPVAHSLHCTKPFGIGEGGLLVTRDEAFKEKVRRASNFGTVNRIAINDGVNAKMSEYHAAVGLAQTDRWDIITGMRAALRQRYQHYLAAFDGQLALQPGIDQTVTSCLMMKLRKPVAKEWGAQGAREGIALHQTYMPPLYAHPYFATVAVSDSDGTIVKGSAPATAKAAHMIHSEMLCRHVVGVPFHPFLDDGDIGQVVGLVKRLVEG